MPILSPQYVIQAPIDVVKSFVDAKTKTDIVVQISPEIKEIKKLLSFFNHIIMEMKVEIMKIQQSEAVNILNQIKKELILLPELDRNIKNLIPTHTKEKEIMDLMRSLWYSILSLIDDLKIIANSEKIDEKAEDYNFFLSNMIAGSIQDKDNKRFVGRKKLLALLD